MIPVPCEKCGKVSEVPDQFAGKRGRCRGCGSIITIPEPATFDLEPATVDRPEPRPRISPQRPPAEIILDPAPPVVPIAVNQSVSVVMPGQPKEANALGVASVIVGVMALGGAWAPFFNLATVPLIFVGGLFAGIGALVVLTSKRTGYLWPIAGAITNAAALVLMVLVNLILTLFVSRMANRDDPGDADEKPAVVRPRRDAAPRPF